MKFKFLAAVNMSIVKVTVFWDVVSFYQTTRCSIPEDSQLPFEDEARLNVI